MKTELPSMAGFEAWLLRNTYSRSTVQSCKRQVVRFIQYCQQHPGIIVTAIRYQEVLQYVAVLKDKNISMRSIKTEMESLDKYYRYLVDTQQCTDNPVAFINLQGIQRQKLCKIIPYAALEDLFASYKTESTYDGKVPPQRLQELARIRNKVIIGMMVYQGLNIKALSGIKVQHVQIRKGQIEISGNKQQAHRILSLQPVQLVELMDYIQETRKEILSITGKSSDCLFTSTGKGHQLQNSMQQLLQSIREQNPIIQSLQQIRTSVIVHWLKQYNIRRVQYLAGHKHITSTEAYKVYLTEELAEDIDRFFPGV